MMQWLPYLTRLLCDSISIVERRMIVDATSSSTFWWSVMHTHDVLLLCTITDKPNDSYIVRL